MDKVSPKVRSATMQKVRSVDTKPELLVRRIIHSLGFRYRLHSTKLPGKPDIVLTRLRKIVLVHGCFWHGHDCRPKIRPTSNIKYWHNKIEGNKARDKSNIKDLRRLGWRVLVIWECQHKDVGKLKSNLQKFLS